MKKFIKIICIMLAVVASISLISLMVCYLTGAGAMWLTMIYLFALSTLLLTCLSLTI